MHSQNLQSHVTKGSGLPITRAALANHSVINNIPRYNPEECLLYLPQKLKPSNGTKDRWIPKKTFKISYLVGALIPVNHKGLNQGWTQTSLCLQVIHFTSYHATSHVFWANLYPASSRHGKLHPAGRLILFCGPTQEPKLATANTEKVERGLGRKCRWMDQKGRKKQGRNPSKDVYSLMKRAISCN